MKEKYVMKSQRLKNNVVNNAASDTFDLFNVLLHMRVLTCCRLRWTFILCLTSFLIYHLSFLDEEKPSILHLSVVRYMLNAQEEIIEKENYPVDNVVIESEDGYLLTLHRIPNLDGPPVFLKHGILSSTVDWLKSGKNRSLPYFLWDHGFDVWIGNARGNAYSRSHKTLPTDDHRFWDFNLHEMGYYDDAAFIEYISRTRSSTIFYVGYSLGALTFSIMAAERPEVAKNVKAMVALAPAIYMGNMEHKLVHLIARYQKEIQTLAQLFKMRELFGHSRVLDYLGNYMCRLHFIGDRVCSQIFYFILGYSPKQLDKTRLPIIFTKYPSGMSFKSFHHILQLISSNDLQKYDYGSIQNMKIYNSSRPPKYNISRNNIPTAVFISKTDPLSTEQDALRFYNELPTKLGLYYVDRTFNHLDFIIGKDISEVVNIKIVDIFS